MNKSSKEKIREQLAGLGSGSIRKSYYQELQKNQKALEEQNAKLIQEIALRKNAEDSLRRINEDLEERVEERTRELKLMQDAVIEAEKIRSLTHLVVGISHEINTPLGNALTSTSYNEFLLDRMIEGSEGGAKDLLQEMKSNYNIIVSSITSAIQIVDKFRMITANTTDYERHSFNPSSSIAMIVDNMKFLYKDMGNIAFDIDIDEQMTLEGYPGIINSVLTEFIQNSITHGFSKEKPGTIRIGIEDKKDYFTIHYSDDGKGIDDEHIKNIYDPFFTTVRSGNTSGLGMYVVYNLIKRVSGDISCWSPEDGGTKCDVQFMKVNKNEI